MSVAGSSQRDRRRLPGGTFRVSYELRDDRLRVEVYDAGALTTPQRRAHDLEAPGDRGLDLLDALASR